MLDLSGDILPIVQALMLGFLMTMAFYWFAEVPKPNQYERTLQALIGTAVIQLIMVLAQSISLQIGMIYSFGPWSPNLANGVAIFLGGVSGLCLAYWTNNDFIYSLARKLKLTSRAATEDSIYVYQSLGHRGVVLQMVDGRRLMGNIETFPNKKDTGFFLVSNPHWVHTDFIQCEGTHSMLISSSDVQWVEFLEL